MTMLHAPGERMRARAPWASLLAAGLAAALVGVLTLTKSSAAGSPLVVHLVQLVLAGGAAYLLDDPAVAVTTTASKSLWRRRRPVLLVGLLTLGSAWVVILALQSGQDVGWPVLAASEELVGVSLLAVAAAAVLQHRGEPEPGALVAPTVLLAGLTTLVMQEVTRTNVFVSETGGLGLHAGWWSVAAVSAVVIWAASTDPARH